MVCPITYGDHNNNSSNSTNVNAMLVSSKLPKLDLTDGEYVANLVNVSVWL